MLIVLEGHSWKEKVKWGKVGWVAEIGKRVTEEASLPDLTALDFLWDSMKSGM